MRRSLAASATAAAFVLLAAPASARIGVGNAPGGWARVPAARAPHVIATVKPGQTVDLYSRPGGGPVERLGATTTFGSPRSFSVVRERHGRWLAVSSPELGNGRVGWIDASAGHLAYGRTRIEVDVDLSRRSLVVRSGGSILRRARIAVGRTGSATPTGRFSITDKLPGRAYSAYYGCCILALSATQPNLPAGWTGGNRIAIHGTPSASDFGNAVSAGCVHAPEWLLRFLMRVAPLGTPVVIRA